MMNTIGLSFISHLMVAIFAPMVRTILEFLPSSKFFKKSASTLVLVTILALIPLFGYVTYTNGFISKPNLIQNSRDTLPVFEAKQFVANQPVEVKQNRNCNVQAVGVKSSSIVDLLKTKKMESDFDSRSKIFSSYNNEKYYGTYSQNVMLIKYIANELPICG